MARKTAATKSGAKPGRFERILSAAEAKAGGARELAKRLPKLRGAKALRAVTDDRYLSDLSRRIFRAGLSHTMVDGKWPAFEKAFRGFDPRRVRAMNDEELEALMGDARIIRHWGKIRAVRDNAASLCAIAEEHGSFANYIADWPTDRTVELWDDLARRCVQMGGNSAPRFLRMVGKDTFVLTDDVVKALKKWCRVDNAGKGKAGRAAAQDAINRLAAESGKPLSAISMILAASVD